MTGGSMQEGSADPAGPGGWDTRLRVIATTGFADYALIDSGDGRKLERFGRFTIERPDLQALWRPALEPGVWQQADATFKASSAEEDGDGGRWRRSTAMPETWPIKVLGITMLCRLTSFRHVG